MNKVRFNNKDKYIGFMTALQMMNVGWEIYNEGFPEIMPIEDYHISDWYKEGTIIKFGEYGINSVDADE